MYSVPVAAITGRQRSIPVNGEWQPSVHLRETVNGSHYMINRSAVRCIGDRDGTATASARRTLVAFAAERKQNASQRSDRLTVTR